MKMLQYIGQTASLALPGVVLLWVNTWMALFANSPRIALRDWRPDADNTAAAYGTAVVIVLAVGVPLIRSKVARIGLAIVFLVVSGIGLWRCYASFELLDTVKMSTADASGTQASWRLWYITMLIAFVAAVTSALSAIYADRSSDEGEQPGGADGGVAH
jgi:hypothetical protein